MDILSRAYQFDKYQARVSVYVCVCARMHAYACA